MFLYISEKPKDVNFAAGFHSEHKHLRLLEVFWSRKYFPAPEPTPLKQLAASTDLGIDADTVFKLSLRGHI